jgi:Putative Mg2+ and Co2+ transporter CorB
MHRLEKQGNRRAVLVNHLLNARERMIGALLFGNNAVNIAASALATGLLLDWFGEVGVVYATIVMTVAIVVFAEILPKTAAFNAPNRIALAVARPIDSTVRLLAPILVAVEWIVKKALRLFGVKLGQTESILSPHEELRGAVDLLHGTGGVETLDRDMLRGLLDLRDLTVSDVMIHRTEMVTVCADDHPNRWSRQCWNQRSPACRCGKTSLRTSSASCMLRIFCGRCRWPRAISARSTWPRLRGRLGSCRTSVHSPSS